MLNLLTFAIINEIDYDSVEFNIYNKDYGLIDTVDGKNICNSLLLESNKANDQFLLDNIDVKKIIKRY